MIVGVTGVCISPSGLRRIKGSGKDEAAAALASRGFVAVALADPIKRFLIEVYGFTEDQLWGPSDLREGKCDLGVSARDALQLFGTGAGRKLHPSTWVDYTRRVLVRLAESGYTYDRLRGVVTDIPFSDPCDVVVPDIRFANEAEAVRSAGGVLVRIVRNVDTEFAEEKHVSEQEVLELPDCYFDHCIYNSGTLADLHRKVIGTLIG